jgi:hypothetical protein
MIEWTIQEKKIFTSGSLFIIESKDISTTDRLSIVYDKAATKQIHFDPFGLP